MYRLCRWLLAISVCELAYSFAIAMAVGTPWSLIVGAVVLGLRKMKKGHEYWAHGTSRFANESDLRKAGMLDADKGLMIGRLGSSKPQFAHQMVPTLLNPRIDSKSACEQFLSTVVARKKSRRVRIKRGPHALCVAPTGVGKGVSLILPWLLDSGNDESAVVLDYKGENAAISARFREKKLRHQVELIDPWKIVTQHPSTLNPMDLIEANSPEMIDDARDLAEQIVMRPLDGEKNPHWNNSAEMLIGGAITAVAQRGTPGHRSLQTVADILSQTEKLKELIEALEEGGRIVARLGGQIAHFQGEELGSVLTTVSTHLRFLNTPAVAQSTLSSSFDPMDLRRKKMTVYLILPPEHMRASMGLIRIWVGTLLRAVVKGGLQRG